MTMLTDLLLTAESFGGDLIDLATALSQFVLCRTPQ